MGKQVVLNEEEICREYNKEHVGIEAIAAKYHVGKLRIKDILKNNGIEVKDRGGQKQDNCFIVNDWKIEKYPPIDGKHYLLKDKNNDFTTSDIKNRSGIVTTHIKEVYGVDVPSLWKRRKFYMITGNYWWEQWFDVLIIDNEETKKCPYCDWETIDVENRSGWFEQHLIKEHNIIPQDYIKEYPEDIKYFKALQKQIKRNERLNKQDEFVFCPLCNQRFNKLTEAHMVKMHNISLSKFREMYPNTEIMSKTAMKQLKDVSSLGNLTVSKSRFISVYEREIQDFLIKHNIEFAPNRQLLIGKEIDILIEKYKLGIEFDGLKFHTEFFGKKNHNYHLDKTLKCNEKGYFLIHIFEDEYVNHKDIVYEKLKHFLHIKEDKKKVYGRNCQIKEIYKHDAEVFLDKFHIQGFSSSTVYLGAFCNDELIAVMTFKNGNIKNSGWELTRFASDYNYICCGVGGKLFNYFIRNYSPDFVYSFADRRWTLDINNNIYTKLGFVIDKINRPDYKYYNEKVNRFERVHKMRFNKRALSKKYGFPLTMTEIEMARELGYDRIYDCGLIKYIWRK